MLAEIFDIASGGTASAIIGLAGSWLTKREARKLQAETSAHDFKMAEMDAAERKDENEHELKLVGANIERAIVEGDIQTDAIEAGAFVASQRVHTEKSGIRWIDGIRSLMRPFLTLFVMFWAAYFTWQLTVLTGGLESLDSGVIEKMYLDSLKQIFFLATLCITWWFGSRPPKSQRL